MDVAVVNGEMLYRDTNPLTEDLTASYPLGVGFLEFLELDFTEQERARLEMLQQYNSHAASPGDLWTLALAVYMMYEPEVSREHPYIKYLSPPGDAFDRETRLLLSDFANFTALQEKYRAAAQFCLDVDFNTSLTPLSSLRRYYLYDYCCADPLQALQDDYQQAKTAFTLTPCAYDTIEKLERNITDVRAAKTPHGDMPPGVTQDMIDHVKSLDIRGGFAFIAPTMAELAYIEFMHMVQNDVKIRKCGNCGRYFILKGNYDGKFCDRVIEGKAQTCQTAGALKLYKAKLAEDTTLMEYERAYKRYYARRTKGQLDINTFNIWSEQAQAKRAEYKNGALSGETLVAWLNQEPGVSINAKT